MTAGKIENIHLPMQVPFCKIQKTIQGPKELNEKIDNLHWQCKSPSGTRIVPMFYPKNFQECIETQNLGKDQTLPAFPAVAALS